MHCASRPWLRPFRRSILIRCAILRYSSRGVGRELRVGRIYRAVSAQFAGFAENSDKHRRNVLQEIFGLGLRRKIDCMLAQFVCHLINNEGAAGGESVVGFTQEITLFFILENAEWNSGDDVVTV